MGRNACPPSLGFQAVSEKPADFFQRAISFIAGAIYNHVHAIRLDSSACAGD
jgi:hypothetical protein